MADLENIIYKHNIRHKKINLIAQRFYAQPKIYKSTITMRPIISSINCPNNKISEYITNILSRSYNKNNPYYIHDSINFISPKEDEIKSHQSAQKSCETTIS